MNSLSKTGLYILSALVGSVFIFSAFTKLYPIEFFELTFLELNILSWKQAPFVARFIIGLEFSIGVLFILNNTVGKWLNKFTIALLIGFSVHLLFQIYLQGNQGNCGCFGSYFTMTPLEGILKNVVLIAVVWLLQLYHKGFAIPFNKTIISVIIVAGLVLPFILNPVLLDASAHMQKEATGYKLHLEPLYQNEKGAPQFNLRKGKWVIAFLSASCPHCKIAAYKMKVINDKNPDLPIYFVINGKGEKLKKFYEETKSEEIPHSFLKGTEFIKISGPSLPAIFFVSDGIVEAKPDYLVLDQNVIEDWVEQ